MDQNTSTIAELRAEQVDQISDNLPRPSCHPASLDASAADSSSSSPLSQRLHCVMEGLKELFNELEPEQLVFVLPKMEKLMERANETKGLDFRELDQFLQYSAPSSGGVSHPPAISPRPPNQHPPSSTEPSPTVSSSPLSDPSQNQQPQSQPHPQPQPQSIPSTSAVSIPRAVPNTPALGHGVGLIRLLQFSGFLANESKQKLQLCWWNDLIREYFSPKAVMRFTLWKDSQRNEAKPFEIGVPILPRFFLATTQSGVKSMTLTLDGARERLFAYGHAVVECVSAIWTYRYTNGYIVTLRGPLTVHVLLTASPPPGPAGSTQTSASKGGNKLVDHDIN
ncbi:hypothetical protein D9758_010123 [Tetrapyrgos nigripes]|uniref:Uncharacterized protein n=1 Tax=Tetrapyrgos nigripes TaxID=182062 RepID=A0A8H5FSB4_9AGAR|nr:hypothetical protein D9758_010123 [Tetrapyrgos nigripes]